MYNLKQPIMTKLKFTTQEVFEEHRFFFDDVPVETLKMNDTFMSLVCRKFRKVCIKADALEFMEIALRVLEEREEFEMCHEIVTAWPELIN
jgi:hypothetical protein